MKENHYTAENVMTMHQCGQQIVNDVSFPCVIYLNGSLGAGKTTLVQGIVQHYNYHEIVSSPSYNLIHQYPVPEIDIAHLDLYRLEDPEELIMLGLADLLTPNSLLLIEWPEKGQGFLPEADIIINIEYQQKPHVGRTIQVQFL